MTAGARCCFGLLALLVQILLHGELALTLYWVVQVRRYYKYIYIYTCLNISCVLQYRWPGASGLPFAFRGSGAGDLDKEWNLHPVLMIAGFIYCMGQGDYLIH